MTQHELKKAGNLFAKVTQVSPAYRWQQDRLIRHIVYGDKDEPTHKRTASLMLRQLAIEMGRQGLPYDDKKRLMNFFEGMGI